MRISDWSSDVCSSDLHAAAQAGAQSPICMSSCRLNQVLMRLRGSTAYYSRFHSKRSRVVRVSRRAPAGKEGMRCRPTCARGERARGGCGQAQYTHLKTPRISTVKGCSGTRKYVQQG